MKTGAVILHVILFVIPLMSSDVTVNKTMQSCNVTLLYEWTWFFDVIFAGYKSFNLSANARAQLFMRLFQTEMMPIVLPPTLQTFTDNIGRVVHSAVGLSFSC